MANGLTTKQKQFVAAYVGSVDGVPKFNATAAARHAGYVDPGQSGWENKQNLEIRARISEILSAFSLSPEETLHELTDVAAAEWRDFVTVRTDPKTGETLDVKMDLGAKVKSLEILAKAHGMLTDRLDLSGTLTANVELVGVDPGDV
jgi:phage terminase small subunit